ncbi:hypothetical protein COT62_00845 [Candidatus Roizmanbacteria bacterium CG09_land_8_20_14_0_10_41_9]|uniref:Methyltransferase domain-containing protein n=1 Tax=Candidatus Roizmanbacteria bacterium CG09_land_8_20_14_0_10_41_9 TaxID=1974850 RepID=A0A2H0WTF5_9BACT|nr:MAG: hypothetical protein COT62_00845 [Candidatus Roizmanbacteria bacterium CG09_land_8_20_14_0_10_41_9]
MIIAAGVVFFILIGILTIFAFPHFSPIPYFPSNKKDIPLILTALNLRDDQIVVDLGAGDGLVVFEAAHRAFQKKLATRFIAVEINPILVFILHLRKLFHSNKKNIRIVWADMFKFKTIEQYSNMTIFLYISPWFLEKTLKQIRTLPGKKTIVSYYYPIKSLRPALTISNGVNPIFVYPL